MKEVLKIVAALGAAFAVVALQGVIDGAGTIVPQVIPDPFVSALVIAAIIRGAGALVGLLKPKPVA